VAQVSVRNLPDELVCALTRRAAEHNGNAEHEHREALRAALKRMRHKRLAGVLVSMPNAGEDGEFDREQFDGRG
jgi:plasmid stability protein